MSQKAIHDTILSCLSAVAPEADLPRLSPDADLRDALDLDSMDFLGFVTGLHKALGVDIPETDYARIATLASCEEYLLKRT